MQLYRVIWKIKNQVEVSLKVAATNLGFAFSAAPMARQDVEYVHVEMLKETYEPHLECPRCGYYKKVED